MNRILILLAAIAMLATIATTGMADSKGEREHQRDKRDYETARELMLSADILPLEEIISRARAVHPGRVLETELERKGDTYIYELEILDQGGRVWEMKYDASTGTLIKDKQDD